VAELVSVEIAGRGCRASRGLDRGRSQA